jgi:hypothetical protein
MSEVEALSLEAVAERVEKLEEYIDSQVTPRFDDVQNEHKLLSERMNEYQIRVEQALHYANSTLTADLYKLIHSTSASLSAEVREKFDKLLAAFRESVQQEIVNSKILTTRPATREEIKSGAAIAVRQATSAEIRQQK